MKKKKLLTIDDLFAFCLSNNLTEFSSKQSGQHIVVQAPTEFELEEFNESEDLMKLKCKVFHTGLNRNKSFITKENAEKCMSSLKNRPILANIHQLSDGTWDFRSHDMEIVEDENGEESINYIESQVGNFTADEPELVQDEEDENKYFVVANAVIPEGYTKAADILRDKNGSKGSMEININKFSFNAKENYLDIEDFYITGYTLLGSYENWRGDVVQVEEGMKGARVDIEDFSEKNNSMFSQETVNTTETGCVDTQKGGNGDMNKFEELLAKYEKSAEDIDFEYEGMSDEELEAKFAELFEEEASEQQIEGSEGTVSEGETFEDKPEDEPTKDISTNAEFELSHEEIHSGLRTLISEFEEEDNEWYYISMVYDDRFVFSNWDATRIYSCEYEKDGNNLSLKGERIQVYAVLVNAEEKERLEKLQATYAELEEKVKSYEAKEEKARKLEILGEDAYQQYVEEEEFKELADGMDNYSVEEFREKAELAFAKCVKRIGTFSTVEPENAKPNKQKLFYARKEEEKARGRYGSLLDD